MITFHNEDAAYEHWMNAHEHGYVVNVRDGTRPPMLHTARCSHLYPVDPKAWKATERKKLCGDDRAELEAAAQQILGRHLVLCPDCDL